MSTSRAGRLSINRTLVQSHDYTSSDNGLSWGTPKTARGRRAISLDPDTVAALRAHRTAQLAERLKGGDSYAVDDLVFCTGSGQPLHPKVASNLFRKAVIHHAMPKLSIHGRRHTWPRWRCRLACTPRSSRSVSATRRSRSRSISTAM